MWENGIVPFAVKAIYGLRANENYSQGRRKFKVTPANIVDLTRRKVPIDRCFLASYNPT